ncbi:MAG: hypothetical protein RL701_4787 [Pseudomonadota bacterium]|jgi:hypothetical protein
MSKSQPLRLMLAASLGIYACRLGETRDFIEETGTLDLQLRLTDHVEVRQFEYQLWRDQTFVRSGTVTPELSGNTLLALISVIPRGDRYRMRLDTSARWQSSRTSVHCYAEVTFAIGSSVTTTTTSVLKCEDPAPISVAAPRICPELSAVRATPVELPLDGTSLAVLEAEARSGPGAGAVAFRWRAPSGVLSTPGLARTNYLCKSLGTQEIQIELSNDDDGYCTPDRASVFVVCQSSHLTGTAGSASR